MVSEDVEVVPVGVHFRASRSSQGCEHSRSLSLEWSTNGSIYLTEHEYGGRSLCPTMDDLRWLRDVLNKIEFCDHDLGEIESSPVWGKPSVRREHRVCKKCKHYVYEGPITQSLKLLEVTK